MDNSAFHLLVHSLDTLAWSTLIHLEIWVFLHLLAHSLVTSAWSILIHLSCFWTDLVISCTTWSKTKVHFVLKKSIIAGIFGMAADILCSHPGKEILLEPTRGMLSCCCWCFIGSYEVSTFCMSHFYVNIGINCILYCSVGYTQFYSLLWPLVPSYLLKLGLITRKRHNILSNLQLQHHFVLLRLKAQPLKFVSVKLLPSFPKLFGC